MSLINEMLKDLEARGDGNAVGPEVRPAATAMRTRSVARSWTIGLGLLAAVFAGVATWLYLDRDVPANHAATSLAASMNAGGDNPVQPAVSSSDAQAATSPVAAEPEPQQVAQDGVPPLTDAARNVAGENPVALAAVPAMAEAPETPSASNEADVAPEAEPVLIVRRHEPSTAQKRERAARDGFAALQRSDWTTAARLLDELLAIEPANDDAREGLVVALVQLGRLSEADGVLLDGLALSTRPARFAKLRARVQAARGDLAGALNSLAVAVPPLESDPEFHALRAAFAQQAGDAALARDIYTGLVAHAPDNGTWQAGLGMAYDRLGERDAAAAAYRQARDASRLDPALLAHVEQRLAALSDK